MFTRSSSTENSGRISLRNTPAHDSSSKRRYVGPKLVKLLENVWLLVVFRVKHGLASYLVEFTTLLQPIIGFEATENIIFILLSQPVKRKYFFYETMKYSVLEYNYLMGVNFMKTLSFPFFAKMICCFVLNLFLSTAAIAAAPQLLFSDLINGPPTGNSYDSTNGAWVTVWGRNLGSTQGSSYVTIGSQQAAGYPVWADTINDLQKVTFLIPANASTGSQTITLTTTEGTSNTLPFYVNTPGQSKIFFATDANCSSETGSGSYEDPYCNLNTFAKTANPGDIVYLRGGTYVGNYGANQSADMMELDRDGTENQWIAWIGYPGETTTIRASAGQRWIISLRSNSPTGDYQVFSQLDLDGNNVATRGGFSNGGQYAPTNGSSYSRWIGLKVHNAYRGYAMSGTIHIGGRPHHKVLGCEIYDLGYAGASNMDHMMYIANSVDDFEFAYNNCHDFKLGTLWQVHTSGTFYLYEDIRVHHNIFDLTGYDNRGFSVSATSADTHVYFYNNIQIGGGNAYGGAQAAYGYGTVHIWNNTFYDTGACCSGGRALFRTLTYNKMDLRNNIIYADSGGQAYTSEENAGNLTAINNVWYNLGSAPSQDTNPINADPLLADPNNGIFLLLKNSPAIDKGSSNMLNIVEDDAVGILRPLGAGIDIGAYEFTDGVYVPIPKILNIMIGGN